MTCHHRLGVRRLPLRRAQGLGIGVSWSSSASRTAVRAAACGHMGCGGAVKAQLAGPSYARRLSPRGRVDLRTGPLR